MHRPTVAVLLALTLLAGAHAQIPSLSATYAWPQHDDVMAALDDAATNDWVTLHSIGTSVDGKDLVLAEITDPASQVPVEDRVVTLITTQQHGNEPAGTPAALQLLEDILAGDAIADTLQDQVLLLWPQANPDGAAANSRANAHGTDLNRDHVHVEEPEVQALHSVILQRWDVHVGMDHHEYSGTGPGYPVPVRTYDWDATILYPRHGNVRAPTLDHSVDLYDHLISGLEGDGYTAGEYGVQTAAGVPVSHIAGGPDPGILRNNFGLNNVVGLLVETFVNDANPLVTPERRIDVHYQVMQDTLVFASQHGDALMAAKRASERLNVEEPLTEYVEEWPDDPVTGEPNAGNVRADLAAGYATQEDLTALMLRHGLPPGTMEDGRWLHPVAGERQGLLAAILHPESTRSVASATAVSAAELPEPQEGSEPDEGKQTPWPAMAPLVLLLAALALRRARR